MFADHSTQMTQIQDGEELVGFAVAVDEEGRPYWVDFIIAGGGKW